MSLCLDLSPSLALISILRKGGERREAQIIL
uniref:Uncharacterized protein n=1 Tax=Physcomitrium patens TaxID=3218 RepID=A0A2K1KBD5_PHYPA|nr:hypothetical protein PHYPA_010270 [Physcomitrium patens]